MADISKEIKDFAEARKGKEVRGSMISLAEKVNREVETNTIGVNQAINDTNAAAANTNATRQDILNRLAAGEFKGEQGEPGKDGEKGEIGASGISISTSTPLFTVYVDNADNGALHIVYDDGT